MKITISYKDETGKFHLTTVDADYAINAARELIRDRMTLVGISRPHNRRH